MFSNIILFFSNCFKKLRMFFSVNLTDDLIKACETGDIEKVKYLVDKGADIHREDRDLRWAIENDHLEVVKYLVEHGSNIHALTYAANNGHLEVAIYLREVARDKWKCHNCIVRSTCLKLCKDWNKK